MEAVSQLILRSRTRFADGPILLVNPEADGLFRELGESNPQVRLSTSSHGIYRVLENMGADIRFETRHWPAT